MHCLFLSGVLDDVHVHAGSWGGEGGGGGGGVGVGLFSPRGKALFGRRRWHWRENPKRRQTTAAAETLGELGSTPRAYNSMDSTDADVREAAPESDDWSDGIAIGVISNITKDF